MKNTLTLEKLITLARATARGCYCDYDYRCPNCQAIVDLHAAVEADARIDTGEIREAMLEALRSEPCKSSELFERVGVDICTGREVLSKLVDDNLIVPETDWVLHAR